jgi:Dolichyl-phosphate-mannose-protein mannosyltransferase
MQQAATPTPPHGNLRQLAWRALAFAVLSILLAFGHARLNRDLQIAFDLRVERPGPYQLYLADDSGQFSERLNFTRYPKAGGDWQRHVVDVQTLRKVTQIRLDPTTDKGLVEIGAIDFRSRWGSATLKGPALQAAMQGLGDLTIESAQADTIRMQATGADPHFVLRLPSQVVRPHARQIWPVALTAGLAAGLLWVAAELASAWMRRHRPHWYQGIKTALVRGWVVPLVVCLGLTWKAADRISSDPILGDGIQNLVIAVNLFKHGSFSLDNNDHPKPTNFREPLDPLLVALHLKLAVPSAVNRPLADFRSGDLARTVKLSNLLWVFAGLAGIWAMTLRLGGSNLSGLIATALSFQIFFHGSTYIDTLYTELSTATLMIWATYGLLRSVQQQSLGWFFGSGVLMGLLALGKASFAYIGIVAVPLLMAALLIARRPDRFPLSKVVVWGLVMGLAFTLTLSPWLARNHAQFGNLRITERGGLILWGRANLNNMSNEEVLGLIHDNSPTLYRRAVTGTSLAAGPDDFERGGRWQRLNRYRSTFWESDRRAAYEGHPEGAVSFHYTLAARYNQRVFQKRAEGHPYPDQAVGDEMKGEAMTMLKERPWRHVAMTVPFFWHGFWSFKKVEVPFASLQVQDAIGELLNLFAGVALFGVFLYGLARRHAQWVAVTVLPVGLMVFYAFLTHNIPRYSSPAHPMMLLALVLVVRTLWLKFQRRLQRPPPTRITA